MRDQGRRRDSRSTTSCGSSVQSPDLLGARIRVDGWHDLVALLRGFAGNRLIYVVPWPALPRSVRMGRYDKALHGRIRETHAITPATIQQARQDVVASGAAGDEAQADEKSRRDREQRRRSKILGILSEPSG